MLTRIYGTAFFSKKDLDAHLERIEQAKARDHRRLGPQLGLFMLREEAPGMPFWLPNGTALLRLIEAEVQRPAAQARLRGDQDARRCSTRSSGTAPATGTTTATNMYFTRVRASAAFALRPMNCPGACLVFGSERHSYRELPLRLAEFGQVSAQRARGRPARAAAGARLHPGRRPRLLHRGADRRRGDRHLRGDRRALRALRLRGRAGRALDPAGEVDRHRRAVGARPRRR